jgi:hypothetical protein
MTTDLGPPDAKTCIRTYLVIAGSTKEMKASSKAVQEMSACEDAYLDSEENLVCLLASASLGRAEKDQSALQTIAYVFACKTFLRLALENGSLILHTENF